MKDLCPVDGTEHKPNMRCAHCGAGYVRATSAEVPRQLFTHCPYDGHGLVVKHRFTYAHMAQFVCTAAHCLFELTQGEENAEMA